MNPAFALNINDAYRYSRMPESKVAEMVASIGFDELVLRGQEMARNELLVARKPETRQHYNEFQAKLEAQGVSAQENILLKMANFGKGVLSAALWPDEYPANVFSENNESTAVHYNLWLKVHGNEPDFRAANEILSLLEGRNKEREVYCFKRPPTQSIPNVSGFPYEHAHLFTTATVPLGAFAIADTA